MSEAYKAKLRSLSFSKGKRGTSIKKPVRRDDDGTVGGFHTEHWDDRQDATVFAPPVRLTAAANVKKVDDGN